MVTGSTGTDLHDLRQRFLDQKPLFEQLRDEVDARLRSGLQRHGLVGVQVDGRVKDVASFVKKALRKTYDNPWDDIRDKVGMRLTAAYASTVPSLEAMVRDLFTVHHHEDKRTALQPNQLDYLGSHFEVSLPAGEGTDLLGGIVFEIQVHSAAEGLWAGISHELLYKAAENPPPETARSLYRLLALVELFDLEVGRAQSAIMEQPGFPEAVVLRELDRHFFALTAHRSDAKLSRVVISALRSLYSEDELADYANLLDSFVATHGDKLRELYKDYLEDDRNPLMSQPESLLIFERLENNFQRVPVVWAESLPESLLRSFSETWGTPIEVDE